MAISTNLKPTIYRNLDEYMVPVVYSTILTNNSEL